MGGVFLMLFWKQRAFTGKTFISEGVKSTGGLGEVKTSAFWAQLGNLGIFVAHLSAINARLLAKLRTYQFLLDRMFFKNNFDMSDSLFSLRLSGFIFRSGNFLPDPFFYRHL